MASALGTLFGEIAGAIREKTGDTATMKPAEFPEKISSIQTGGGKKEILYYTTDAKPTSSSGWTINHNLGVVPDIVIVMNRKSQSGANKVGALWLGFSDAMVNAGLSLANQYGLRTNSNNYYSYYANYYSIHSQATKDDWTHYLCNVNETSLTVLPMASNAGLLDTTNTYRVIVYGGLT